jgi:alpha-1,3-rhamnosyl/mannosyltransferase
VRVAFDGFPLLPPRSGIGEYTYQLVRALARVAPANQHVVFYPCRLRTLSTAEPPEFPEPNVRVLAESRWAHLVVRARRRLGLEVAMEQYVGAVDVYHAPNYIFTQRVRCARRVVTIHDMTVMLFPEWHPRARVREMVPGLARTLEVADHILADSEATKQDIVKCLSVAAARITVAPLAADAAFRPLPLADTARALRAFGLEPGAYLLFMGTLEPRKNLNRLLDAVERCDGRVGPLVLAGAQGWGGNGLRDRIERLERHRRVRYLGYVPAEVRPALMSGARAFLYPSLYEGFGLPPLEAMACGAPVLTSAVSSLPEVVGDAAVLVDPYDVDALAAGMTRLWEDDGLRADLRQRGLAQAARFSWERTARLTLAAYERTTGASRA